VRSTAQQSVCGNEERSIVPFRTHAVHLLFHQSSLRRNLLSKTVCASGLESCSQCREAACPLRLSVIQPINAGLPLALTARHALRSKCVDPKAEAQSTCRPLVATWRSREDGRSIVQFSLQTFHDAISASLLTSTPRRLWYRTWSPGLGQL
jgi:hypothetical protein